MASVWLQRQGGEGGRAEQRTVMHLSYTTRNVSQLSCLFTLFISTHVSRQTVTLTFRHRASSTECNRRNGPDFGRVFLRSNYTDITPKHLYPKLNGYGDIGQRKEWTSLVSAYCTLSVTSYSLLLEAAFLR